MSDTLKALLHPFTTGLLPRPAPGRAFLLRAEADDSLDDGWRQALVCQQTFKPSFDALRHRGFAVARDLPDDGYDAGLCLLTKHKLETLANLARAWEALRPGGVLVAAGSKDVGAGSVERAFKAAVLGQVGDAASLSKCRCRVFWAERGAGLPPILADWAAAGQLQRAPETGYWSRPGLYNWNKIDDGSAFLAQHLPHDMTGRVADLGAGWGYLSLSVLARAPDIASLDLYDAEWLALDAAKANLAGVPTAARLAFHWHDVATGLPEQAYDLIVANPPFHRDKASDIDLGRAFITAAAQALARGGRLLFVANRHLPYESVVRDAFRDWRMVAENAAYKVILGCS